MIGAWPARLGISLEGRETPAEVAAIAAATEAGGAGTLWVASHLFLRDPVTLALVALGATHRIRVALVAMSPYAVHPVPIAMAAATLDAMSGGRLDLGIGVGAYREEFAAWAPRLAPRAHRGGMVGEAVAMISALFTEDRVTFTGTYYACRDVAMAPKPVQSPLPLYAGGHTLACVERSAAHGRDPSAIEVAPQFSVTVARTMEAAEARHMASDLVTHRVSLAFTGRDQSKQVVANLVGSPDVIREKVAALAAIGVQHCCGLMFPADTLAEYREQVAWFAEVVGLPRG
ncbi:MAG: LLM class flavin-dependent oxidoreductase [Acetobacteraceae bacterium]|nr:LLM class flavin-dependent oxidoreductase [Acetobacteraceae bacterium]